MMDLITVNYTTESKAKLLFNANYTNVGPKESTKCKDCIFVGRYNGNNGYLAKSALCAKHVTAITEVKEEGTCDSARSKSKWYNQINPIKKLLLERNGFKFNNR